MNDEITTAEAWVRANGITASVVPADATADDAREWPNANHWRVRLYRPRTKASMTVRYHTGLGISQMQTAADVLESLAADAAGFEQCGGSFEQWASEYGYDADSRKAEKVYRAVEKQTITLRRWAGEEYGALLYGEEGA